MSNKRGNSENKNKNYYYDWDHEGWEYWQPVKSRKSKYTKKPNKKAHTETPTVVETEKPASVLPRTRIDDSLAICADGGIAVLSEIQMEGAADFGDFEVVKSRSDKRLEKIRLAEQEKKLADKKAREEKQAEARRVKAEAAAAKKKALELERAKKEAEDRELELAKLEQARIAAEEETKRILQLNTSKQNVLESKQRSANLDFIKNSLTVDQVEARIRTQSISTQTNICESSQRPLLVNKDCQTMHSGPLMPLSPKPGMDPSQSSYSYRPHQQQPYPYQMYQPPMYKGYDDWTQSGRAGFQTGGYGQRINTGNNGRRMNYDTGFNESNAFIPPDMDWNMQNLLLRNTNAH